MELPIKIFTPNAEQFAKSTSVNMAFRFGMSTGSALKAKDIVANKENLDFNKNDYMGAVISETLTLKIVDRSKVPVEILEFTFNECIITVNLPKNIVTTSLQGKNGTIKEYISEEDYQITLNAAIDNFTGNENSEERFTYPQDKLSKLIKLLRKPLELLVYSEFLSLFNIESVVVKSFNLGQEMYSNRQSITIELLSDEPYEIKLKNNKDVKVG